jgi:hypothetical protein
MRKIIALLILLFSATTWADDYEDGLAAFNKKNYLQAVQKFKSAVMKGNADAQTYLGHMYEIGLGVTQDFAEAFRLYTMAAVQGQPYGQNNLASMYLKGQGITQDYAEALRLYKLAAEQGLADAQFRLGAMYANGQGTKQDFMKTHMWFNLAAAKGDKDAQEFRDRLAKSMTSQQIAQAQNLARECLARKYKNCD